MRFGKTAVYTILKNESKYIEKWLYYAEPFDYQVLLDTGSTDGSFELLQEYKQKYPNLIVEQKTFFPWRFDVARKYNQAMIPDDVVWCLSPDLDEYFSINTHNEMEKVIENNPSATNIACDRLDIYSPVVRVTYPDNLPSNKIHLKNDYTWSQPIYEHLQWKHKDRQEVEVYSDKIFLIHDQDFKKKERPELYIKMLEDEYRTNPSNLWTLWFLVNHYYSERNITKYVPAACDYIKHSTVYNHTKYKSIIQDLVNIHLHINSFTLDEINSDVRLTLSRTVNEASCNI